MTTPAPPGRAITELQKRAALKRLLSAWLANPQQRLGQLITNATHGELAPLFYLEDDAFLRALERAAK